MKQLTNFKAAIIALAMAGNLSLAHAMEQPAQDASSDVVITEAEKGTKEDYKVRRKEKMNQYLETLPEDVRKEVESYMHAKHELYNNLSPEAKEALKEFWSKKGKEYKHKK